MFDCKTSRELGLTEVRHWCVKPECVKIQKDIEEINVLISSIEALEYFDTVHDGLVDLFYSFISEVK